MRTYIVILLLLMPIPAWAWGAKSHRIIADFAQRQLAAKCPGALTPTLKLLGVKHLADVAATPDAWPENTSAARAGLWHFVNIPYAALKYDAARDCSANLCMIGGINYALQIMNFGKPNADPRIQREALLLLIHLTGDLYQPFHCATSSIDHNAESIRVTVNGTHVPGNYSGSSQNDNLHFVWDVSLVEWRHLTENEYVSYLFARVAKHDLLLGTYTPIPDVAEYSHTYALDGIKNVSDHTDLKSDYMNSNADVVDQQLVFAGTELVELIQRAWLSKLDLTNCKP